LLPQVEGYANHFNLPGRTSQLNHATSLLRGLDSSQPSSHLLWIKNLKDHPPRRRPAGPTPTTLP
jgi:hypothetical protein